MIEEYGHSTLGQGQQHDSSPVVRKLLIFGFLKFLLLSSCVFCLCELSKAIAVISFGRLAG